jgi:hypothetical protein
MTTSVVPLTATAQRIVTLECGPCALYHAMQRRGHRSWTPPLADFAVDLVAGALTLADATEVLVPESLVRYVEEQRAQMSAHDRLGRNTWPWPAWDAALHEQKLVTWVTAQSATSLLRSSFGAHYTNLCVPVPAGPLVAQIDFGLPIDVFYRSTISDLLDVVSSCERQHVSSSSGSSFSRRGHVRWRAWMRSALTCAYEGTHVPPNRVSDYTSELLRQDGGCEKVIWEAAVGGLTPRWLETAAKTAIAVGIHSSTLTLSLPDEASCSARLLAKSVDVGITAWTTCALTGISLHNRTNPLCTPQSVRVFTTGWNELSTTHSLLSGGSSVMKEEEGALVRCADFADAAQERFHELLPPEKAAA